MKLFTLSLALLLGLSASAADEGATIYQSSCASCHGAKGMGDGVVGKNLPVKPAKFSDKAFWAARKDAVVAKAIKSGGVAVGKSPMMPALGAGYTPAQMSSLIKYMKTLVK